LRQPQLELVPFDASGCARWRCGCATLSDADRARLEQKISGEFIERLVAQVTEGFRGDVGVVPRQFLRALVTQMDLVDEEESTTP
jgi:BMFP domain-containing protein YqiC